MLANKSFEAPITTNEAASKTNGTYYTQDRLGFFFQKKSAMPLKAGEKSSCHGALGAAGTETAAVRLHQQSGPSEA